MSKPGEYPTEQALASRIVEEQQAAVSEDARRQAGLLEAAATLITHFSSNAGPVHDLARIELEAKGLLHPGDPLDPLMSEAQAAVETAADRERRVAENAERFRGWTPQH